jgi:hypothetical protein
VAENAMLKPSAARTAAATLVRIARVSIDCFTDNPPLNASIGESSDARPAAESFRCTNKTIFISGNGTPEKP